MQRANSIAVVGRYNKLLCVLLLIAPIASIGICQQPLFEDVTAEAGIDHFFEVFQGTFGGGAVVIDYDKDGWEDLYITGGQGSDQLLKNEGDGTFSLRSQAAGLHVLDGFVTQGAASADVNKDGWPDLYITTIASIQGDGFTQAPNFLMLNNGDGSFSDYSLEFGFSAETFSTSASFGDVNKDGYPDIYVCNYFDQYAGDLDEFHGPQTTGDIRPGRDQLYINNGGKSYTEASEQYGIQRVGLTFQALWSDYDNDGDLDILVANDFGNRGTPNLLYRNEYPRTEFEEVSDENDFDFGINAMGIGACDINEDGWLDYKITNIQISPLLVNAGPAGGFREEAVERGSGFTNVRVNGGFRITPVSWGVNFFDIDNDSDSDLYITNGCLNPQLTPNPNLMLENVDGTFQEKGFISRSNDHSIGRGSVVFDYDLDGDLDLLVVNQRPYREEDVGFTFIGTRLYKNQNSGSNHWIKIKLQGREAESSGIGSRIEAYLPDKTMIKEVYGGSSHESQNSTVAHFGLGHHTGLDSVVVRWSSGNTQVLYNIASNQTLLVEEEITDDPTLAGGRLSLFPNAFDDHITLQYQLPTVTSASLRVSDVTGKHLFWLSRNVGGRQGNLSWQVPESLISGVYLFSLETPKGAVVKKGLKR